MIRYPNALKKIKAAVELESPGWQAKAVERTNIFAKLGKYVEEDIDPTGAKKNLAPFWGDIKKVYTRRQHNKCIYCETQLEASRIQWDLEHFRPKARVRKWPDDKSPHRYDFATGDECAVGYHLLAYHIHNYAVACKTCNTEYKCDFFPIAANRTENKRHPRNYSAEEAFLTYPLSKVDDDPEDLITFVGVEARPKFGEHEDVRKWRWARIMIDFLGLNREGLVRDRAGWLLNAVWPNMELAAAGDPVGLRSVKRIRSERSPFTNCGRCFLALFAENRSKAEAMIPAFEDMVDSA